MLRTIVILNRELRAVVKAGKTHLTAVLYPDGAAASQADCHFRAVSFADTAADAGIGNMKV